MVDKTIVVGLLLGAAAVIGGQYLEGGSLRMIFQVTAAVIVFGGTLGAVCLSFPLPHLQAAWKEARGIFWEPEEQVPPIIARLIEFAYRTRREGILSLEKELPRLTDPFFRRALQLAVDGLEPQTIRDIMEMELEQLQEAGEAPARVFEAAGGYAPTIGILGAVLGLIQVMSYLTDPGKLGTGVAVAFVATIYGVGAANLFFLPLGHRLRLRHRRRLLIKQLILEGVLAVCSGDHPRLIEENLKGFMGNLNLKPSPVRAKPASSVRSGRRSPTAAARSKKYATPSIPSV